MEKEKGFWPISNISGFFSALYYQLSSNRAAIPSETMSKGSHLASYPASLAPISHSLPSNYCSYHLTLETPTTFFSSSPFQTNGLFQLSFPWLEVVLFRKSAHTFHTIGAISMTPCAVCTRKSHKFATKILPCNQFLCRHFWVTASSNALRSFS